VIEHINPRDATKQIEAELVAQKATNGHQISTIYVQAEKIAFQSLWYKRLTRNLSDWREIARERGILVTIATAWACETFLTWY
jgi:hypothetical protein